MRAPPLALVSCLMLLLSSGPSPASAVPPPEDCAAAYPGVNARLDRVGRLLIGGQPDEEALRRLAGEGVRVVINLRTPAEMADRQRVPFDQAAVLAELGVKYIHLPVNNSPEFPWRPEIADAIRDALAEGDGTVLLHCQSGMRTAWAYAAHCIREHATPLNDAMDLVGALQDDPSGHPICPLLGIETTFEFADPPHGSGEPRPATDSEPRPAHPDLAPAPAGQSLPPAGLHAPTPAPPEVLAESSDDFTRVLARVGPLYISGQPSQAALRRLRDEGVSVVINLRTPREMDNREWVPFDEAAVLAELGIDYVRLPLGRPDEHPWTPGVVDAFARALAEHEGKALLHCTVAWRASLVWAAYLVRHHAMDLNQALEQAGTIYPLAWPLEGLLERRILLRITREPRPEAGTPPGEVAPAHHAPQPS